MKAIVLKENLKHIRFMLANSVDLRRTPTIEFKYDDTAEEAVRVFELLEKIKEEKK